MSAGQRRAAALAVCLIGFAVRVGALEAQSLWYDEAFSLLVAHRPPLEVIAATARDNNPPLYYLLLWAWSLLGAGEFWWRFLSVMAGALVPPLTFALGRRTVGTAAALFGALLAALAPFLVFYSQETRMYALLCLSAVLAAYAWLRWTERGAARWGLLCWAALTAGLYTHTFGVMTLLALGAAWAVRGGLSGGPIPPRSVRQRLLQTAPLAAAGLAFLPWLGVVARQAARVQTSFWTEPPTLASPLISLHIFLNAGFLPAPLTMVSLLLVLLIPALALPSLRRAERAPSSTGRRDAACCVSTTAHTHYGFRDGQLGDPDAGDPATWPPPGTAVGANPAAVQYLAILLTAPIAAALLISLLRPVYLERTLIGSVPAWCLLLGWSLTRLPSRWASAVLGGGLLALAVIGLGRWHADPSVSKPPYRWAADLVRAGWQEGDAVVHTADSSLLPFLVALPELPQSVLEGDPVVTPDTVRGRPLYSVLPFPPAPPERAGAGARRVWLVVAPEYSAAWQHAAAEQYRSGRRTLGEWERAGVTAVLLEGAPED